MPTLREQLRGSVIAALSSLPSIGSNVFVPRVNRPLQDHELPALLVSIDDEAMTADDMVWPPLIERRPRIVITAVVEQSGDYDTAMERIWAEVEPALAADQTLGGTCQHTDDFSLGAKESASDGDRPVMIQRFSATAILYARFGSPGTQA
jgi:hypothetical protein